MEDIRTYSSDQDETLRQWPKEDDSRRAVEYEAREDEVPFHVPRD